MHCWLLRLFSGAVLNYMKGPISDLGGLYLSPRFLESFYACVRLFLSSSPPPEWKKAVSNYISYVVSAAHGCYHRVMSIYMSFSRA